LLYIHLLIVNLIDLSSSYDHIYDILFVFIAMYDSTTPIYSFWFIRLGKQRRQLTDLPTSANIQVLTNNVSMRQEKVRV